MRAPFFFLFALLAGLAGCDQLGIESTASTAARREAEGKAIGGGCRHAARSLEQCYEQNKRADKAAVFAGWREMNDYMRENKIESQPPVPEPPPVEVAAADDAESDEGEPKSDARLASKGDVKADSKTGDKTDAKVDPKGKSAKTAKP
ncbi:MAG TPA: hypothetical protein VK439_12110 [Rubrivivax sp.]|nr:hypothetical protein [Rubrivivax sp.]